MERVTFPDPEVQEALAKFELCKLDIDEPRNREVCARIHRGGGVPAFVALGPDGMELSRWDGALGADAFVAKLRGCVDDSAARLRAAGNDHGARAEIHAARGDVEPTLKELAALTAGGGTEASAIFERELWRLCATLQDAQRWSDLEQFVRMYLLCCVDGPHTDDARVALGLATFAKDGTTTPELQAHIDHLVVALGEPVPKRSAGARFLRFFGASDEEGDRALNEAVGEWVDRMNATTDQLFRLGRAALPALHRALRDGNRGETEHAADVIGRIRDPSSLGFLRDLLDHADLDVARRTDVVRSLGMFKDAADLPRMVALANSDAAPLLRAAAIDAIKDRCVLDDGTTDRAIADALSRALESREPNLRLATLQAMYEVHAPLALDRLLAAMDDSRVMFLDVRVCDNALWIFENQIGRNVVDRDGVLVSQHCTPIVAEYLNAWYADARTHLRWNDAQLCWVDDRETPPPPR